MKTKTTFTTEQIEQAGHDADDAAKINALCELNDCEPDDLSKESHTHYGLDVFSMGRMEFAIGTDAEADAACAENCKDSAWAFNASFLASLTELPEECFEALQAKCEDGNDAVVRMIEKTCGLDEFVSQAISADGRGHFLSGYDGNEDEAGEFYVYRIN